MDIALAKILTSVYELEGLLLVADKHGEETPSIVFERIRNHARTIHEMVSLLEEPASHEPEVRQEPQKFTTSEPIAEPPAFNPQPDKPVAYTTDTVTEDDDRPLLSPEDEPKEVFTFNVPADNSDIPSSGMSVEEKLQRSLSKDLRKAFSVNDRFRFKRELFGNSEAEFVDAINMIESMHSYSEATDYFLGDLGWDEDVAEVAEFLNIVRHHFDE